MHKRFHLATTTFTNIDFNYGDKEVEEDDDDDVI